MKNGMLLALGVGFLLVGCQSKKEICAQWEAASQAFRSKLNNIHKYRDKLGIETPAGDLWEFNTSVPRFCEYYKR